MNYEERRALDEWARTQDPNAHMKFRESIPSRPTSELLCLFLDSHALMLEVGSPLAFVMGAARREILAEIDIRIPPREPKP